MSDETTGGTPTADATPEPTGAGTQDGGTSIERKTVLTVEQEKEPKGGPTDTAAEGDPAKAKEGASEPYEVKVPEGVKVDAAKLDEFTGWAKGKGLSAAQATAALAFYAQQQSTEAQAWAQQSDRWYGELEKDPEFGGSNLKESSAALQRGLKRFDPRGEFTADLQRYGIENMPSLARFLRRVGLAVAEDRATVDTARAGAKTVPSHIERLAKEFPSLAKELLQGA